MSIVLICWALLFGWLGQQPAPATPAVSSATTKAAPLDYEFFKTKVQPIFINKRPGHARCISCHATSQASILILQPLPEGSTNWNDADSRKNFASASRLIIPGNPMKSILLRHPLAESAGGDFFHNGGKHFNSQDDPEWQVLKAWATGAKAASGSGN